MFQPNPALDSFKGAQPMKPKLDLGQSRFAETEDLHPCPRKRLSTDALQAQKRNDPPSLLGQNPFFALFSKGSGDVLLNNDCLRRYHSQPHSQRT